MKSPAQFVAVIFGFILAIALGILVMIYGWGLEPKSWGWIIGGGVGLRIVGEAMVNIAKKDKS